MRSIVYHQFRKELHIIKTKFCISSSRQFFDTHLRCDDIRRTRAAVIYTLTRGDIPSLSAWIKKSKSQKGLGFFGPSDWSRTSGLLNPIQALYQTEPHPDRY